MRALCGGAIVLAFFAGVTTTAGRGAWPPDSVSQDPDGEKLYGDECSFCHGDKGRGDGQLGRDMKPRPPDISDPAYLDETPDEEIIRVIKEGAGDMGPYEEFLSEPAMRAIVAHMRQLGDGRREAQEPTEAADSQE